MAFTREDTSSGFVDDSDNTNAKWNSYGATYDLDWVAWGFSDYNPTWNTENEKTWQPREEALSNLWDSTTIQWELNESEWIGDSGTPTYQWKREE